MKKFKKKIFISKPYLNHLEKKELLNTLKKSEVSSFGSNINKFEKKISNLSGSKYNLATNSGSSSLIIAFKSAGVKINDIIISQSYTFAATTNSIVNSGAIPWLFDINKNDFSLDLSKVENKLENETYKKGKYYYHKKSKKRIFAICPVLVFSIVPNLSKLNYISKKYHLKIILDAASAIGSKYKNKSLSKYCDMSIFSFNGNKVITTGSGGLISTNNKKLYEEAKLLSVNGKNGLNYNYNKIGFNSKMNNLSASIGLIQIKKFKKIINNKRNIYKLYENSLKRKDLSFIPNPNYSFHTLWLFSIILKEKLKIKKIISKLSDLNVESKLFWKPMHMTKVKNNFILESDMFLSEFLWDRLLVLPSSPDLSVSDQKKIIYTINNELSSK